MRLCPNCYEHRIIIRAECTDTLKRKPTFSLVLDYSSDQCEKKMWSRVVSVTTVFSLNTLSRDYATSFSLFPLSPRW